MHWTRPSFEVEAKPRAKNGPSPVFEGTPVSQEMSFLSYFEREDVLFFRTQSGMLGFFALGQEKWFSTNGFSFRPRAGIYY